jgi:hypothetical protein
MKTKMFVFKEYRYHLFVATSTIWTSQVPTGNDNNNEHWTIECRDETFSVTNLLQPKPG